MNSSGKTAYIGYFRQCNGKSLISGAPLPEWEDQSDDIKAAWEAAAASVLRSAQYPHLLPEFLQAMDDIGRYGHEKYGEQSFQHRAKTGNLERWMDRVDSGVIAQHVVNHLDAAIDKIPHDHFATVRHQFAAAAFNVMMESFLSGSLTPPK